MQFVTVYLEGPIVDDAHLPDEKVLDYGTLPDRWEYPLDVIA
jgi:hypothetical protein